MNYENYPVFKKQFNNKKQTKFWDVFRGIKKEINKLFYKHYN